MRIYAHAVDILNYPLFGDIQLFPIFSYQYLWWCLRLQMLSEQRGLRMCGFKGLFGKKGSGTSVFILLFYHPSLPWLFPKLPGIKSYCWCAFSPPLIPFKLLSWLKYLFFLNYSLKTFIFIGFHTSFFLFQVHSWHMEVPEPGIESETQLWPTPQLWQRCVGQGLNPQLSSDLSHSKDWILNLLCHSRNSRFLFLI